jgi:hypothetical protein
MASPWGILPHGCAASWGFPHLVAWLPGDDEIKNIVRNLTLHLISLLVIRSDIISI